MHAALGQFSTAEAADFVSEDVLAAARAVDSAAYPPYRPSAYRPPRLSGAAAVAVLTGHVLLLVLLASIGIGYVEEEKREPLVVNVIELPTDPPQAPPPDQPMPVKPTQPQVVAPRPAITLPPVAPTIQAVPEPPPAAVIVPPQPAATPGPVTAADLSTSMISAAPPKYPMESRRKKEQGTVVLSVLVGTSGAVQQVSIARSSGSSRLDKAALDAVRRWRWSPAVRNGQPVMVKGYVDIPFVLT